MAELSTDNPSFDRSYQKILRQELLLRTQKNSAYSLRAFARFLEIEAAQLSRILNGKQNLSVGSARRVAEKLYLENIKKQDIFVSLVEYQTSNRPSQRTRALEKLKGYDMISPQLNLQLEVMNLIKDWYHYAILDLSTLEKTEMTPQWISQALEISVLEARDALERLVSLGLLEEKKGKLKKSSARIETSDGIYSESIRAHQSQMIEKAKKAIHEQSIEERYLRTKTMAISKKDLPQLKVLIAGFLEKVDALVQSSDKTDTLQQLNLQLFDLAPALKKNLIKPKILKRKFI